MPEYLMIIIVSEDVWVRKHVYTNKEMQDDSELHDLISTFR